MDYHALAIFALDNMMSSFRSIAMEKIASQAHGEVFVLNFLLDREGTAMPKELSFAAGHSMARISMLIGGLEQKGLVVRETDSKDRRRVKVMLTQSGHEKAKAEREAILSNLEAVFREMGEQDSRDFLRTAGKFFETASRIIDCEAKTK